LRDFFIYWMERIINVLIAIGAIGVFVAGLVVMFSAQGGFLQGIVTWIGGAFYLILMGGMIYLGLGIYDNTRRTAEAVERMTQRP